MIKDSFGIGLYSPRVATWIARVRYQSFQAWAKANLLHVRKIPLDGKFESAYTYRDLLLIRLIVRLKKAGAKPKAIRAALDTIAYMSGGDHDAWMKARLLVTDGLVVVILDDKPEWSPIAASRGTQKMMVVFFPELIEELKSELVPPDRFPHIEINPEILGGAPVVKGTRIPTRAVVAARQSGQDPTYLYPTLTKNLAAEAEAYEEFLQAA